MNRLNSNPPGAGRRHDGLAPLKNKSGVYLLYVNQQLYVGSTKNLQARLRNWAAIYPGAEYAVLQCQNHREREQIFLENFRSKKLRIKNVVNAVKPIRQLKGRPLKKIQPPKNPPCPPRMITMHGVTRSLTQWCRAANIPKSLFYARLQVGWTEQQAVQPRCRIKA